MINQILEIVGQLSYDNIYQLAGDVDSNNRICVFARSAPLQPFHAGGKMRPKEF